VGELISRDAFSTNDIANLADMQSLTAFARYLVRAICCRTDSVEICALWSLLLRTISTRMHLNCAGS